MTLTCIVTDIAQCPAGALHPGIPASIRARMVGFLRALQAGAKSGRASFGAAGGPWEFNLRDLLRWCCLMESAMSAAVEGHRSAAPRHSEGLATFSIRSFHGERLLINCQSLHSCVIVLLTVMLK